MSYRGRVRTFSNREGGEGGRLKFPPNPLPHRISIDYFLILNVLLLATFGAPEASTEHVNFLGSIPPCPLGEHALFQSKYPRKMVRLRAAPHALFFPSPPKILHETLHPLGIQVHASPLKSDCRLTFPWMAGRQSWGSHGACRSGFC